MPGDTFVPTKILSGGDAQRFNERTRVIHKDSFKVQKERDLQPHEAQQKAGTTVPFAYPATLMNTRISRNTLSTKFK